MNAKPGEPIPGNGAHTLIRGALLRLIDQVEADLSCSGEAAFLHPGDAPADGWDWLPRAARDGQRHLVLIRDKTLEIAVMPPFPLETPGCGALTGPLGPLRDLLLRKRLIAVVLLRLGAYAVGVLNDGHLVLSKTGNRYVHGRHRAGGQSQRRFERNREKWMRELFDEVCEVCRSRLGPYAGEVQHLAIGGDRHVLGRFLKRCEWIAPLAGRRLPSRVPVRRPGLAALKRAGEAVWSSRVYVRRM